jgi:hypothetical protein
MVAIGRDLAVGGGKIIAQPICKCRQRIRFNNMAQGQCVQIVGTGCLTAKRPRCIFGARIRHYVESFVNGLTNDMIVAML